MSLSCITRGTAHENSGDVTQAILCYKNAVLIAEQMGYAWHWWGKDTALDACRVQF